jgi:hypothetical protein
MNMAEFGFDLVSVSLFGFDMVLVGIFLFMVLIFRHAYNSFQID